jgi:hypothetical protein
LKFWDVTNGQAARLIRNKCRGRAAQRPYVRLRPLAYVTGSRPRGSIGSPPERGAEANTVWSGHVSAPDPRLALIKAWVSFVPESRDPAMSGPDPTQRDPRPVPGVRFAPVDSRLEGGVNRAKLKFTKIITTTSRVSVSNKETSPRERAQNKSQANKNVTRGFVLPRFGSRKPTPR